MCKKYGATILAMLLFISLLTGCSFSDLKRVGNDANTKMLSDEVHVIPVDLTKEEYGIGVDKDQPALLKQLNEFIKKSKEDGTFDEILNHYFGDGEPQEVVSAVRDDVKDQLIVTSTLEYAPFEYGEYDKMYGIDLEIAQAFADYLGKELVLVIVNFDMMFMATQQHRCDMCLGAITINEARKEYMDFSDPYYTVGQNIVVRAENTEFDSVKDAEELVTLLSHKTKKSVVAVESGTTSQDFCEGKGTEEFPGLPLTVRRCTDVEEALHCLLDGEVDYVMADSVALHYIIEGAGGGQIW